MKSEINEIKAHAQIMIKPRADWKVAIEACLETCDHDIDHEWLDADLVEQS